MLISGETELEFASGVSRPPRARTWTCLLLPPPPLMMSEMADASDFDRDVPGGEHQSRLVDCCCFFSSSREHFKVMNKASRCLFDFFFLLRLQLYVCWRFLRRLFFIISIGVCLVR